MIEQANDGDGCKLFVTTYTLLDFPSLDQAKRLSFIKNHVGSNELAKMVELTDLLW